MYLGRNTRQADGQGHTCMNLSRFDFGMENMFCLPLEHEPMKQQL